MKPLRVLYLSHDGLTDPLGRSQILPYLEGLSKRGHTFTVISAEKRDAYAKSSEMVRRRTEEAGIQWEPLDYHRKPPILAQLWDLWRMQRRAEALHRKKPFDLVHCRSYPASLVGMKLRARHGLGFLFDMRGFWADERRDGNIWPLGHPIFDQVYRYFKRKEKQLLKSADRVICLTHRAVEEIESWTLGPKLSQKIRVIPCCCDLEHFDRLQIQASEREQLRHSLQIAADDFVLSYLGSVGTWYLLDEMLSFFGRYLQHNPKALFLFITPDSQATILARAQRYGVEPTRLRFYHATREKVPVALSLSNIGLFFIKPAYSKRGSSPTKLAEYLSMGVPVISNAGVGDSDWLAGRYDIGPIVSRCEEDGYSGAISQVEEYVAREPATYRQVAEDYFSLHRGVQAYADCYEEISELKSSR